MKERCLRKHFRKRYCCAFETSTFHEVLVYQTALLNADCAPEQANRATSTLGRELPSTPPSFFAYTF